MLSLNRFFIYSIVFHITFFILAFTLISPVNKNMKRGEFFARIISPEEVFTPAPVIPEKSKVRPILPSKSGDKDFKLNTKNGTVAKSLEKTDTLNSQEKVKSFSEPTLPAVSGQDKEGKMNNRGNNQRTDLPGTSLREKLFDSKIIGDIAKREIKKDASEDKKFSFNVRDMRYLPYLRRLKERIESIWIYPPDAATRGIYGDLIIKFTIKKNGSLGATELIRTSGHKSLDDAALRALREAEPFWPLPDEWGLDTYTIEGHFIYTIYGYYIR